MNLGNNLGKELGISCKSVKFVYNGNSLGKNLRFEKIDYNLGNNLGVRESWLQSWLRKYIGYHLG